MFVFTYLMANHFPWTFRYRDELSADWRDLGNGDVNGHRIDEYLRRQDMSAHDYKAFVERLKRDFPDEPFLIVRFGDHQPMFAKKIVDAGPRRHRDRPPHRRRRSALLHHLLRHRRAEFHARPICRRRSTRSMRPICRSSILEAAGVPLDASFAEQKRIFQRCNGLFYLCASGAEARRFNRLLIDAGMIKRL